MQIKGKKPQPIKPASTPTFIKLEVAQLLFSTEVTDFTIKCGDAKKSKQAQLTPVKWQCFSMDVSMHISGQLLLS